MRAASISAGTFALAWSEALRAQQRLPTLVDAEHVVRFAGKRHDDLCEHLAAIMPTPARLRVRSRRAVEPMLAAE